MGRKQDETRRIEPFNPLDKKNLGATVADRLLQQPLQRFPVESFIGAGIYAIYYDGDSPLYRELAQFNREEKCIWPLYVGKAVPAGARKGGFGLDSDPGKVLFSRLNEHAKSISASENLSVDGFGFRFLVVDDIWIPLGESLLIESFSPIWNKTVDGFGNHDPGKGRYKQKRSRWDLLHPGRKWAERLQPNDLLANELAVIVSEELSRNKRLIMSKLR